MWDVVYNLNVLASIKNKKVLEMLICEWLFIQLLGKDGFFFFLLKKIDSSSSLILKDSLIDKK